MHNISKKPWGYEYLAYETENVGVWILHINSEQCTSMHCHPTKTTGLIVIDGAIELSFLGDKTNLNKLEKRMIRRGLFHRSKAISNNGAILLEIETPNSKNDLVRLDDIYGRETLPCESIDHNIEDKCIRFEEPVLNDSNIYNIANCELILRQYSTAEDILENNKDSDLLIFLKGGIIAPSKQMVTIPGDVGSYDIIKKVCNKIPSVTPNTLILTLRSI